MLDLNHGSHWFPGRAHLPPLVRAGAANVIAFPGGSSTVPDLRGNISAILGPLLDQAMVDNAETREERTYLGASSIGNECLRQIQFDYTHTPRDAGRETEGRIYRIFERGHGGEAKMARWWRMAGFVIKTEDKSGEQFGFSACGGLFQGHSDGVLIGGPAVIRFPALWEHKELGAKGWNNVVKNGLAAAFGYYYAQVQLYLAYLALTENPAIFTATNADTQEIYFEAVPFDPANAQKHSDRAVKIIEATKHGELMPRIAATPDHFYCKSRCSYPKRCWEGA